VDKPTPNEKGSEYVLLKPSSGSGERKWNDYGVVKTPYEGSKFIKEYVERFNTVSFFNEYAGLLSIFYVFGQVLAPYVRIPIHGSHLDTRVHVYWIQQSRTGKSAAYEFTKKLLAACEIEAAKFTSGSDAGLLGHVREEPEYDDDGKPTGKMKYIIEKGLLNGYKTLLFDEASVLLDDKKAYFSEKILYLQEAMAPIGSATNNLAKILKHGNIQVVSGVSIWATTFPPKDIMHHVLEKGFFQRVFLYQNDVSNEQRQTTSEHRLAGTYVPVPSKVWEYDKIAEFILGRRDDVRNRLLKAAKMTLDEWDALEDYERDEISNKHCYDIYTVDESYHAALLNATSDYYEIVNQIRDVNVRETATSFIPNLENYTITFSNIIATIMGSKVITADHVMMATEIIFDNLHNLVIWLEQKQDFRNKKKRDSSLHEWKVSYGKCKRMVHTRSKRECVSKRELEKVYAVDQGVSVKTAQRRLGKLTESPDADRLMDGRNAFIALNW
jgi:hypothetical protein